MRDTLGQAWKLTDFGKLCEENEWAAVDTTKAQKAATNDTNTHSVQDTGAGITP